MVKRKLTDEDILSLPDLYSSGLSSLVIAEKFNTCHSNILHHLRKLAVNLRNRSSAAKEGVKAGRILIKKHKIPKNLKLNEDLSYILGVIAGDGFVSYNTNASRYQIGLSAVDREFVDEFRKVLFNFFKIKPTNEFKKIKIKNWNDQYITRLCSKEACDFINSIGDFGKAKWRVPSIIMHSGIKIKSAFLKGFFDSEGEIDKKSRRVGATSMNLEGLREIKKLLDSIGIRASIIKVKDLRPNTSQKYILRIQDRKSIELFNKNIRFTILRKQEILDTCVDNYKFTKILPERLTSLISQILELKRKGISYTEIANDLNLNLTTVWNVCNRDKTKHS